MDTTYWGRAFGVMLFKDNITKENLLKYYVKNQQPDLLITAIRPSNTNLYNKMKGLLGLDLSDLEKVELSSKTRCLYKEDASENLLIQLEKTPLQLIKEKIRALFS